MIVTFEQKYLEELYLTGKTSDKRHRFQPDVVVRYQERIRALMGMSRIEDLYQIHALHYEVLRGDKQGISSIRVNHKYRIEFEVSPNSIDSSKSVFQICNVLELSNHYK